MGEQERRMATKFACHSHRALSSHCLFLLFVFDLLFASDQNTHQLHNAHTLPPLPHLPLDIQRHSHPWYVSLSTSIDDTVLVTRQVPYQKALTLTISVVLSPTRPHCETTNRKVPGAGPT
ncbi:hypothetical protein B0O80DRAFT_117446 [Mortierella sp. GBAus27b]|nr:hypothetical protein B0O80DRAFT_117446 [Mortierella sp. GBAus27b]